ncbi:MAG TPA: hypothetical protein VK215_10515 [Acidimicrobiales bacterium]|nr:hypothetical protein [Acidimicrobiales bacterium]
MPTNVDEGVGATAPWVSVVVGGTVTGIDGAGAMEEGAGSPRPADGAWWAVFRG